VRILVNSYNTLSAGTSNISRQLVDHLLQRQPAVKVYFFVPRLKIFEDVKSTGKLKIVPLPVLPIPLRYVFRFFYDMFFLPLFATLTGADAVLVMANYAPARFGTKKVVLIRHPHLVDNSIYQRSTAVAKVRESLRRLILRWTVRSSDDLVFQSDYMRRLFLDNYSSGKTKLHVLGNPVKRPAPHQGQIRQAKGMSEEKIAFYVSRYYPHKNHEFVLELATRFRHQLQEKRIKIYTTVDPSLTPGAREFVKQINSRKLQDVIVNIGEIQRCEVEEYYRQVWCLLFPSKTETFGNPLAEAMCHGLPVIVPDLGYSRVICEDAGVYYKDDDVEDAFSRLSYLCGNSDAYEFHSRLSLGQSRRFPDFEQWVSALFSIAGVADKMGDERGGSDNVFE
jgi:glycosyltransferase involved in cell wall biosynthesis